MSKMKKAEFLKLVEGSKEVKFDRQCRHIYATIDGKRICLGNATTDETAYNAVITYKSWLK